VTDTINGIPEKSSRAALKRPRDREPSHGGLVGDTSQSAAHQQHLKASV